MKFIPENEIWEEFWKRYHRRPEGWRIYSGITMNGYPEVLITGEKESWLMRRDSVYSGKLGIGGRIEDNSMVKPIANSFGFREISIHDMDKIFMINREDIDQKEKIKIITGILKKPPTTLEEIKSSGVIQGPMLQSNQALPIISREQAELDRELNNELNKWKRRISYLQ